MRPTVMRLRVAEPTAIGRGMAVVGFSFLTALSAQVAIPLPFTPVPITAQTLVVLLSGVVLGRHWGALSMLLYLGYGAAGWPVFSGGRGGIAHLLGPTGGYLWGFVLAAYVVGALAERGWDRPWLKAVGAMGIGQVVIYLLGVGGLLRFVPPERVLALGVWPFLIGDLLKIGLAATLLRLRRSWLPSPLPPQESV